MSKDGAVTTRPGCLLTAGMAAAGVALLLLG